LSDNITVVSVVDRYLEHSRIIYFHHGGDERLFISSADWMPRNLDRRVELLVPIVDASARDRLLGILETYFRDTVKGRRLQPDGTYKPLKVKGTRRPLRSQETLYQEVCEAVRQAEQSKKAVFEPHRATGTGP
jgi:polyphosphate kinase